MQNDQSWGFSPAYQFSPDFLLLCILFCYIIGGQHAILAPPLRGVNVDCMQPWFNLRVSGRLSAAGVSLLFRISAARASQEDPILASQLRRAKPIKFRPQQLHTGPLAMLTHCQPPPPLVSLFFFFSRGHGRWALAGSANLPTGSRGHPRQFQRPCFTSITCSLFCPEISSAPSQAASWH